MGLLPLLIRKDERVAADRYADAVAGKARNEKIERARDSRGHAWTSYVSAAFLSIFGTVFSYGLAEIDLRPGTSMAPMIAVFLLLYVVSLGFAAFGWTVRRLATRKIAALSELARLPEDQEIVDDRTESYTHRVVRAAEVFNAQVDLANLLLEGIRIEDLPDRPAVHALAARLATQRVVIEECVARMRFWRNPLLAKLREGQAQPSAALDDALDELTEAQLRLTAAIEADLAGGLQSRLSDVTELDAVEQELRRVPAVFAHA